MPPLPEKPIHAYDACGLSGTMRPVMLQPMLRADASASVVVFSTASAFGFTLLEPGKPARDIIRNRAPEKLTIDMVRRMFGDSTTMYVNTRPCTVPMAKVAEESGIATHMPPYSRFVIDPRGRIWAVRMTFPKTTGMSDLFSPTGVYLGTVSHGGADPIAFLSDGGMVSLEPDADDAPVLVVYDIKA